MEVHGALLHGAVPRAQPSVVLTQVRSYAWKPAGSAAPAGTVVGAAALVEVEPAAVPLVAVVAGAGGVVVVVVDDTTRCPEEQAPAPSATSRSIANRRLMSVGTVAVVPRAAASAAVALAVLCAIVVAVAALAGPGEGVGSPAHSRVRFVEDVIPPRKLRPADIRRGGPTCLSGHQLVVPPGGGCTFIVPDRVHVVEFRRVPDSPGMDLTLTQTDDLTQSVDTSQPGPDPAAPLRLRFAAVHGGTTVTLSGCRGPSACRLDVAS